MADKIQRVRGTQDLFGEDIARFDHVVETFNRVRKLYGFRRVDVPVFEPTAVFARSLGETTDVVSKEMYSFEDRGGDSLTLRPEFTAGIARAYIQNGWQQHAPLKLAAHGPLFRYERPQKGRYRQFHQLDAEVIGAGEPAADVEVIALGAQLLRELGIADRVTLQLNTLGDAETRAAWREALVTHFHRSTRTRCRGTAASGLLEEPAAHPRFEGRVRPAPRRRRAGYRRAHDERGGRLLRGGAEGLAGGAASISCGRRRWCAASTITATPRSSSSPTTLAAQGTVIGGEVATTA